METIRGRKTLELDFTGLMVRLANYNHITLDLGTGDGRYVRTLAKQRADWFIIGVDSCRENLREHSQAKLQNALFIIASAGFANRIKWADRSHHDQLPLGQFAGKFVDQRSEIDVWT